MSQLISSQQTISSSSQHELNTNTVPYADMSATEQESGLRSKWGMRFIVVLFSVVSVLMLLPMASHADSKSLSSLFGNSSKSKFLKVTEAFQTVPVQHGRKLSIDFVVTPKHYVYKQRVSITLPNGKKITPLAFNQKATVVNDPEFGKVPVFQKNVRMTATLPATVKQGDVLKLRWQGCAKAGLCYPPVTEKITVKAVKKKR